MEAALVLKLGGSLVNNKPNMHHPLVLKVLVDLEEWVEIKLKINHVGVHNHNPGSEEQAPKAL